MIEIRKAGETDYNRLWEILKPIILRGDVFVFPPTMSKEELLGYWCSKDKHTYVAVDDGEIAGTFFIKDNQPGLGSHVANAGYAVADTKAGRGIGKFMGEFSLEEAKRLGYSAMQFNMVIKSNDTAVRLWSTLGFTIIGEIPDAFNHQQNGLTNAYIMYRKIT